MVSRNSGKAESTGNRKRGEISVLHLSVKWRVTVPGTPSRIGSNVCLGPIFSHFREVLNEVSRMTPRSKRWVKMSEKNLAVSWWPESLRRAEDAYVSGRGIDKSLASQSLMGNFVKWEFFPRERMDLWTPEGNRYIWKSWTWLDGLERGIIWCYFCELKLKARCEQRYLSGCSANDPGKTHLHSST